MRFRINAHLKHMNQFLICTRYRTQLQLQKTSVDKTWCHQYNKKLIEINKKLMRVNIMITH